MRRRTFLQRSLGWLLGAVGLGLVSSADGCKDHGKTGGRAAAKPGTAGAKQAASAAPASKVTVPPDVKLGLFSPAEGQTLEAMLERLIPSNVPPGTPGARETRVIRYLDRQLKEKQFAGFEGLVRGGLRYLDLVAKKEHHARFADLGHDAQDDILARFQVGRIRVHFPLPRFFIIVETFALEGFLGAPKHGGNAHCLAWSSIGFGGDACGGTP